MFVYQIEVSNVCSLRCAYCPHPGQERRKGFMSVDTFSKCLQLFRRCENRRTLRLHNFGEVLMHPRLAELIAMAATQDIEVSFFTNGVAPGGLPYPRSVWQMLAAAGLRRVDFSSHVLPAEDFRRITSGLIAVGRVFDPHNRKLGTWAGQTGPAEGPLPTPCLFERDNAFVVLWDGRISSCCLDVEGRRDELWIDDLLRRGTYTFEPLQLCASCGSMRHQEDL